MTITISHNTLPKCTAAATKRDLDQSEMSKIVELFRLLQRNITRFLDWLLWAEEWTFVVTNKHVAMRSSKRQFTEGEIVSPNFLAFPRDCKIQVEVEENEFIITPDNRFAQWFASPMVFYGHAIFHGNVLNIVGKYSITNGLRIYYAFGIVVFFSFNLMIWPRQIFDSPETNDLLDILTLGISSGALVILGMAVFLVLFKYIAVAKWRAVNRAGRIRLQNYISNIPEI